MKSLLLLLLPLLALPLLAHAGDETQTLPKGIFGVRLNNVFVTGTDYEFGPDGQRRTIGETHESNIVQQGINSATQSGVGKLIYDSLVKILQGTTQGQSFLNSALSGIDLGEMRINVVPTTTVQSPTLMYGLTNKWSLIVNVPFIKMQNQVSWEYVPGSSTATLNGLSSAANLVGVNIPNSSQFVSLAQSSLAAKGYKPMQSGERSFMGDIYVMNLIDLGKSGRFTFGTMNTISLPTGPSHDPDDLLDAGSFHHTFVEQEFTTVYSFDRKFKGYLSGSFRYYLPEQTAWRVPATETDLDPDLSQEGTINRQVGMTTMTEGGLKYRIMSRWNTKAGLAHYTKAADKFNGDIPGSYDLIENTYPYNASSSTSYKLGLTYDPLSNYKPGSVPLMVDLSYEEVIAGTNTPSIKQITLSLSTFF